MKLRITLSGESFSRKIYMYIMHRRIRKKSVDKKNLISKCRQVKKILLSHLTANTGIIP